MIFASRFRNADIFRCVALPFEGFPDEFEDLAEGVGEFGGLDDEGLGDFYVAFILKSIISAILRLLLKTSFLDVLDRLVLSHFRRTIMSQERNCLALFFFFWGGKLRVVRQSGVSGLSVRLFPVQIV